VVVSCETCRNCNKCDYNLQAQDSYDQYYSEMCNMRKLIVKSLVKVKCGVVAHGILCDIEKV
jgi:hypothetical protein